MKRVQYANLNESSILKSSIGNNGMKYTGIEVKVLKENEIVSLICPKQREYCVVLLYGYADLTINEQKYQNIGNRMTVFSDEIAYALYIAPNDSFSVKANTECSIAICEGLSDGNYKSRLLVPKPEYIHHRGAPGTYRIAKDILPESDGADTLLIVEVITKGGNWSSFPSHRHDQDDLPDQSLLEEIYYHKLSDKRGFALQGVYSDTRDLSEGFLIQDDTLVHVEQGYHPVAVPQGVDCYYLNVMVGPKRTWVFHNDPFFEHLIVK